jgi:DNA-binding XRE family transcriptional regulator
MALNSGSLPNLATESGMDQPQMGVANAFHVLRQDKSSRDIAACMGRGTRPLTDGSTKSLLLAIGLQSRVMPHVEDGKSIVSKSLLLVKAASLLRKPALFTEQASRDLGETVAPLARYAQAKLQTDNYDATRTERFIEYVPDEISNVVIIGAEAHGCIMQTGFSLLKMGKPVTIVADAVGSRQTAEKGSALCRLAQRGAEIVTAEMTVLEWLGSRAAPCSDELLNLVEHFRDGTWRQRRKRPQTDVGFIGQKPADTARDIAIGTLLRKARLSRALTLAQLATQAECSLGQLSKIENNKTVPSLPLLYRLSEALGKDVESFLTSAPPTGLESARWANDDS